VLENLDLSEQARLIQAGLDRLKLIDTDIVLVDPQYTPDVISKPSAVRMVGLVETLARQNGIGVFHRFAAMRDWRKVQHIPFKVFTSDDGLHMNDWSSILDKGTRQICPYVAGGTNFWPSSYSRKTGLLYVPTHEGCGRVTTDTSAHVIGRITGGAGGDVGRITGSLLAIDPATSEVKKRVDMPYPNSAGALSTAGGIVVTAMIDGTILAYDDQTLDELWRINVGSGFNAPPITYAVNGKQYIAIASGLCCDGRGGPLPRNSRGRVARTPELRMQGNATVVWVFGL
jgi:hypothetical protein